MKSATYHSSHALRRELHDLGQRILALQHTLHALFASPPTH